MSSNPTETVHEEQPSLDDCCRVLANEQRRIIVAVFKDQPRITRHELADEIAYRSSPAASRREVEVSLVHNHLPLLTDIGAIENDDEWVMPNTPVFGWLSRLNHLAPDVDDAFNALTHHDRRQLLLALADHYLQRDHSLDYLDDVAFDSSDNIEDIHARMHHTHLPMLEEAGFIERYDGGREVSIGRNFDEIRPLLQVIDQETEMVGAVNGQ